MHADASLYCQGSQTRLDTRLNRRTEEPFMDTDRMVSLDIDKALRERVLQPQKS